MAAKMNETQETCTLPASVQRDHADRLTRIETKIDQILQNQELLFEKDKEKRTVIGELSDRVLVIETEKKTMTSLLMAIGAAIISIAGFALSCYETLHKK